MTTKQKFITFSQKLLNFSRTANLFYYAFVAGSIFFINAKPLRAQDDYAKWLKKEEANFNKYVSEEDKKFSEFLKKEWKEFQIMQGINPDEKPKPEEAPAVEGAEIKTPPPKKETPPAEKPEIEKIDNPAPLEKPSGEKNNPLSAGASEETKKPGDLNAPDELVPPVSSKSPLKAKTPDNFPEIDFSETPVETKIPFCGSNNIYFFPQKLKVFLGGKADNKSISDFWLKLSSKPQKKILEQVLFYKSKKHLNDWAYILFLKNIADEVYKNENVRDEKLLFIWFFLVKSGYNVKAGLINDKAFIFFPSKETIYEIPYFVTSTDIKNYILSFDKERSSLNGTLFTYEQNFPGADKIIDMNIIEPPEINNLLKIKYINFKYSYDKEIAIPVKYNPAQIELFKDYPYADLSIYFNAAVNEETKVSLLNGLKPLIKNKTETEAANLLLNFVQFSFMYKTDAPNFGKEKPLFVEETLFYPYSDCEDRAVLFSFLVKNLLGLNVLGVDYPGHVAAAVKFNEKVKGDFVNYNNEKYIICDPTYMGATAGMAMPEYKHEENIKLILLAD